MKKVLSFTIISLVYSCCLHSETLNEAKQMATSAVQTKNAPQPIGPYSQAVRTQAQSTLYISGQIPFDPANPGMLIEDLEQAAHQVMKYLHAILVEADMDFSHVAKTTIFLTSMADFPVVNKIYSSYFQDGTVLPARETVAVVALPKGACLEISMIAVR